MKTECDVCIIGSGVAGGLVAEVLLRSGKSSVVMIEAGRQYPAGDRRKWLDYMMGDRSPFQEGELSADEYSNVGAISYPLKSKALWARGGSTLIWEGVCPRLMPEDFVLNTQCGLGADWGMSYSELEPFYAEAEHTLQISGDSEDPGHPPRSTPFPLPPFPYEQYDTPFVDEMIGSGYSMQHACLSRNSVATNSSPNVKPPEHVDIARFKRDSRVIR